MHVKNTAKNGHFHAISGSFIVQKQPVLCLLADDLPVERGCVSSIALAKEDVKAQPQHVAGTQGDGNKVNAAAGLSFAKGR